MFCFIIIALIIGLVFFAGTKYSSIFEENIDKPINNFTLNYRNDTSHNLKVRYKYILNYELASPSLLDDKVETDIFHLSEDKYIVAKKSIGLEPFIPIYSKPFTLKSNEVTDESFDLVVNKSFDDIRENIRFESKVIVEILKDNKWTPVYQVILMERGPYWSLDKGPIEILEPL